MDDIDQVLADALHIKGNQAGVAGAVGLTRASVSAWYAGRFKPDYEACLRLAVLTRRDPAAVLQAAGHDAALLRLVREQPAEPERIPERLAAIRSALTPETWNALGEAEQRVIDQTVHTFTVGASSTATHRGLANRSDRAGRKGGSSSGRDSGPEQSSRSHRGRRQVAPSRWERDVAA